MSKISKEALKLNNKKPNNPVINGPRTLTGTLSKKIQRRQINTQKDVPRHISS